MENATLYRDDTYGALTIHKGENRTLITTDHGMCEADFEAVLGVLESRALPGGKNIGDGMVEWTLRAHPTEVMASISGVMRRQGYGDDRLGAKAIIRMPVAEAAEPDLPGGDPMAVRSEAVRAGLLALAALVERAAGLGESVLSANFYPRPNRTGIFNRPLPFLRVQVEGLALDPVTIQQGVRQAFSQTEGVVRISASHGGEGKVVVEAAFALPATILEGYESRELPTFTTPKPGLTKEARFSLDKQLPEDVERDIRERALQSGCALEVTVTERVFKAVLPCSQVANMVLSSRIRWLNEQLRPWGGQLAEVGEIQEANAVDCSQE